MTASLSKKAIGESHRPRGKCALSKTGGASSTYGARTPRLCGGRRASCSTRRAMAGRAASFWQLKGERVGTLGEDRARLKHGRMIKRQVRT